MKKYLLVLVLGLFVASTASAHVVVNPKSVGVGARQVFTVSVPTEKEIPTIGVRLVLPEGIKSVTPNVKPGWRITVKKQSTGKKVMNEDGLEVDEMIPTEIEWTGGSIPAEQRDEFIFSSQAPTTAGPLNWKAYQTYQDGTVVAWDQTPGKEATSPYSVTNVIDDLATTPQKTWWEANQVNLALGISVIALVIALGILLKNDKKQA